MPASSKSKRDTLTELFANFGFDASKDSWRPYSVVSKEMLRFRGQFMQKVLNDQPTPASFPTDNYQDPVAQICATNFLGEFHGLFLNSGSDHSDASSLKYPEDSSRMVDILAKIFCLQEKFHQKNQLCREPQKAAKGASAPNADSEEDEANDDDILRTMNSSKKRKRKPTKRYYSSPSHEDSDYYTRSDSNYRKASEQSSTYDLQRNIRINLDTSYPLDGSQDGTEGEWLLKDRTALPKNLQPFTFRYMHEHEAYKLSGTDFIQNFVATLKRQVRLPSNLTQEQEEQILKKCKGILSARIRDWIKFGLLVQRNGVVCRHLELEKQWRAHRSKWIEVRHNGRPHNAFELQEPGLPAGGHQFQSQPTDKTKPGDNSGSTHSSKRPKSSHGVTNSSHECSNRRSLQSLQTEPQPGDQSFETPNPVSNPSMQPSRETTTTSTFKLPEMVSTGFIASNSAKEPLGVASSSSAMSGMRSSTNVSHPQIESATSSASTNKNTSSPAVETYGSRTFTSLPTEKANSSASTLSLGQPNTSKTASSPKNGNRPRPKAGSSASMSGPWPSWAVSKTTLMKKPKSKKPIMRPSLSTRVETTKSTNGSSSAPLTSGQQRSHQFAERRLEKETSSVATSSSSEKRGGSAPPAEPTVAQRDPKPTQNQSVVGAPVAMQHHSMIASATPEASKKTTPTMGTIAPAISFQSSTDYTARQPRSMTPPLSPVPAECVISTINSPASTHSVDLQSTLNGTNQTGPTEHMASIGVQEVMQPSASAPPKASKSLTDGPTAYDTEVENFDIELPGFAQRKSTPYHMSGDDIAKPDRTIVKFQRSPTPPAPAAAPLTPTLELVVDQSLGDMNFDNCISEESFSSASLSNFVAEVIRRRPNPSASIRSLRLSQRWGKNKFFNVDRLTTEEDWERLRDNIGNNFSFATELMPEKRKFEVYVHCEGD